MSESYDYSDYNRGGMLAFSFSMVVTLAFFVYVAFVHSGVDLKELPDSKPAVEATDEAPAAEAVEETPEADAASE